MIFAGAVEALPWARGVKAMTALFGILQEGMAAVAAIRWRWKAGKAMFAPDGVRTRGGEVA